MPLTTATVQPQDRLVNAVDSSYFNPQHCMSDGSLVLTSSFYEIVSLFKGLGGGNKHPRVSQSDPWTW
jgi:hypothetical protein